LKRALAWGRREVEGTFISDGDIKNMNSIDLEGISNGRVDLSSYPSVKSNSAGVLTTDILQAFSDL
jgi:hypothetical protein